MLNIDFGEELDRKRRKLSSLPSKETKKETKVVITKRGGRVKAVVELPPKEE